ncbi:MAG: MFS transporter [Bacteroidetes bacterium]|nr:MFS transporter [Bacteroidota bacterium]
MEFENNTERHNFRCQLVEGALYLSTRPLLSPETMLPALVQRLGGTNVIIGLIPVIVYLTYLLPQLIAANIFSKVPIKKGIVVRLGFIQRVHIFFLAIIIIFLGDSYPTLALVLLLLLYASNQATAGIVTPSWGEFVAKTVSPSNRGKLLGLRTSIGAFLGFLNGFLIVVIFGILPFPWSYGSIFILAGMLQMSSLIAQEKVIEKEPSTSVSHGSFLRLYVTTRNILVSNKPFRQFLIASSFLVISYMSVAFFTVDALQKFSLDESYIGVFTVITIIAQMVSAIVLGWLADRRGSKSGLIITGGTLIGATALALWSPSVYCYYGVFFLIGITISGETFLRYNIAVEYAPINERALYVGLMNAWFAPFYLSNIIAGWLSVYLGFDGIFIVSLLSGCIGVYLLVKLQPTKGPC